MKTIGILTSGGDAPGMNPCIRAITRTAIYNGVKVIGFMRGYEGLLNGDVVEMDLSSVADIIHRGGTILRTARCNEFTTEEGLNKALNVINVFSIDGLIVLGGDGTFKGAKNLNDAGVPTICIPCTIDNDMGYTDYSIGFFTAVETVINAIGKIRDTSTSHGRANIVEVMGRECGNIALYSGLAGGAESIIVPEVEVDMDTICKRLIQGKNRGKLHSIIVLSEGIGNAYEMGKEIEEKTGTETKVTILGHIQRGGTPTIFDRVIASKMGYKAVTLLLQGETSRAIGMKENKVTYLDLDEALSKIRHFDNEMYDMAQILSI